MKAAKWMVLAAAGMLAACGGDDNGTTGPGNGGSRTFSAEVTGDLETSVKGAALFGTKTDEAQGTLFGLEMAETGDGESVIQIIRLGGQIPAPGTYEIKDAINTNPGSGDFVAMAFDSDNGEPTAIFVATGGTLTVTSSTATSFKGTFTFDAEGGLFSDPETTLRINVAGTFHAAHATADLHLNAIRSR